MDGRSPGVSQFQSGSPYDVGFSIPGIGNQNLTGSYTEGARIKLIGNPLQGTSDSPYNRLNPAAFTVPPVGSIGLDSPVRYLRTPGVNNTNLPLQKSLALREGSRLSSGPTPSTCSTTPSSAASIPRSISPA